MKHLPVSSCTAVFLFALGVPCVQAQEVGAADQIEDDRAALDDLRREYVELYNQGDVDGVVELFAEDVLYYDPRGRSHEGKDALQEAYEGFMQDGFTQVNLEPIETEILRDNAYHIGRYVLANGEPELIDGYYVALFVKEGEEWRIHRLIANMAAPDEEGPVEERDDAID